MRPLVNMADSHEFNEVFFDNVRIPRQNLIGEENRGWYQMANDFFDWHHDGRFAISTYFRSEADRRKRPEEPVAAWFVREGFDWGTALLGRGLTELERLARGLNSRDLSAFMHQREALFQRQRDAAAGGLDGLRSLVAAFG